jgi:hypothetical protein
MRKTKPNLGGLGYVGKDACRVGRGSGGERNVQNEPNEESVKCEVSSVKSARSAGPVFRLQTSNCTLHTSYVQNEPNSRRGRAGRGQRGGCRRPNARNEPNWGRGMERSYGGMERGVYRVGIPAQRRWAGRVPPVLLSACEAINAVGSGRRACPVRLRSGQALSEVEWAGLRKSVGESVNPP